MSKKNERLASNDNHLERKSDIEWEPEQYKYERPKDMKFTKQFWLEAGNAFLGFVFDDLIPGLRCLFREEVIPATKNVCMSFWKKIRKKIRKKTRKKYIVVAGVRICYLSYKQVDFVHDLIYDFQIKRV